MGRIKRTFNEFKKITWIKPKECIQNIGYVLGFSTGMCLFLFGISYLFGELSTVLLSLFS